MSELIGVLLDAGFTTATGRVSLERGRSLPYDVLVEDVEAKDVISGRPVPLSDEEQRHAERVLARAARRRWDERAEEDL